MIVENSITEVPFKNIKLGDTFRFGYTYCMRTNPVANGPDVLNAVCLTNGSLLYFDDTEIVSQIKVKMVVG